MRIAIAHWRGRISPLFDAAEKLLIVDMENGQEVGRREGKLLMHGHYRRAQELSALDVDILLCGALSKTMEFALLGAGVQVEKFLRGEIGEVLDAYVAHRMADEFPRVGVRSGPGKSCRGNGRRNKHRRRKVCPEVMEAAHREADRKEADQDEAEAETGPVRVETVSARNAGKKSRTSRDNPALSRAVRSAGDG